MEYKKNNISIILPVFNEERSIVAVIKDIKKVMSKTNYKYEIIAVNDGSTDKTKKAIENIKDIRLINHPYNIGYGASLKTGIKAAKNELIIMLDADGTYPVEAIPKLLSYSNNYDLVSGVRIGKGAKIPLFRKPAKFIFSKLANFLVSQKIPDLNCGLRLIKKSNVLQYFNILPQHFSFTITHLLACLINGNTVKFVPIKYHKRKSKSTIHPIKDFIRFNTIILRVITYFNPFKIFFLISSILFLIAFLIFLYSNFFLHKIMDISIIILLLSSLQIFLFGLIADLIVKRR